MRRCFWRISGLVLTGMVILAAALYGGYKLWMDPYRGTVREMEASGYLLNDEMSSEAARSDLEYLMERLRERHPAWLDGSGKDKAVEKQYEEELERMGNPVSVLELYQAASRITARLHDGHTSVRWNNDEAERYIDDFSLVRSYGNPVTIDGAPGEELLAEYKKLCSYETDEYVEALFWEKAVISEAALQLCGVDTTDGVTMTFADGKGQMEHHFDFVPLEQVKGYERSGEENSWVSYEIRCEDNLGIFTLHSCVCNEEYESALAAFFEEVNRNNVANVVIDLRGNGGGNSWVANEFLKYIDVDEYRSWDCAVRYGSYLYKNEDVFYQNEKKKPTFAGKLYVLTDIWTYSAAMDFAMLIEDNGLGSIVGQASGNLPDSYGDCLYFQLPSSGLALSVSYKRWYRIDQEKAGEPIVPDVAVAPEKALDAVYELIGK